MKELIIIIDVFFQLLSWAIVIRIVMSWLRTSRSNAGFRFLYDVTEPILRFFRNITPRVGYLDFSPVVAIIAIDIARFVLISLLSG